MFFDFSTEKALSPHMIILRVTTGHSFTQLPHSRTVSYPTPFNSPTKPLNPLSSNPPSIANSGATLTLTPSGLQAQAWPKSPGFGLASHSLGLLKT
jgi:hypothetical protein